MENLGNDLSPAVEKIDPAVLYIEIACFLLLKSLMHKTQITAIIEFPDKAVFWKNTVIRQG